MLLDEHDQFSPLDSNHIACPPRCLLLQGSSVRRRTLLLRLVDPSRCMCATRTRDTPFSSSPCGASRRSCGNRNNNCSPPSRSRRTPPPPTATPPSHPGAPSADTPGKHPPHFPFPPVAPPSRTPSHSGRDENHRHVDSIPKVVYNVVIHLLVHHENLVNPQHRDRELWRILIQQAQESSQRTRPAPTALHSH